MSSEFTTPAATVRRSSVRWSIAFLVSTAIAISYLDRQTLPWAIKAIQSDIPFSNEIKAGLDSAFLVTYGLMYVGGGLLLDRLGTRRGFLCIMIFWSLACASHGLAGGVIALAASRLLLGIGEGGGFPAATRAVAEWFPVNDRATAMGIINAGTAVGAVAAPPLIAMVLTQVNWFGLAPWRWVFFLTGALGLLWTIWWWRSYQTPDRELAISPAATSEPEIVHSLSGLLQHRETWAVVGAKFLSDGAWYFYLFWLPKYLFDAFQLDISSGRQHRLDSLRGVGRRLSGWRRIFELAAQARPVGERVAQARAGRQRGVDAVGDARAAIAFRRLGDFYFQPRVFRPAIVVHTGDDSPDGHDFQARRRHARRPRRLRRRAWAAWCSARSSAGCATTVTATRPRSSSPVRCTLSRSS